MTKEALKLALEALEEAHYKIEHKQNAAKREQAITAIKEALAQPPLPVQEPVAWIYSQGAAKVVSMNYVPGVRATPLYATPPAAQPAQEPVAWGFRHDDGAIYDCISPEAHADCEGEYTVPLYAAPPAAQPDYRAVKTYHEGKPVYVSQPAQESAFGWIKQSELAQARLYGGSVNLWLEKHDCDFPVYTAPPAAQPEQKPSTISTEELIYMTGVYDGKVLEREACAKVAQETICDTHIPTGINIYGTRAAKAIRERGNT